MFESIVPLLPRHPFEAASSVANELFGVPSISPTGEVPSADRAYGTVSWPLRKLAALGDGFYGDVEQLLNTRTLLNYRRPAMKRECFESLRRRAIDGVVSPSSGDPDHFRDPRPPMVCPLCVQEALADYGTLALLWPHQAPWVDACWMHGARLVRFPRNPSKPASRVEQALAAQVNFARDVVTLCEMARDLDGVIATVAARIRDAGFQYRHGRFCRERLTKGFQAYVQTQVQHPVLQKIGSDENATTRIVRFLTQSCGVVPPVLLVLFLGFLRQVGVTAVTPAYARSRSVQLGTWSAAEEPKLDRPERHEVLALRLRGYSALAVATIKGLPRHIVFNRVWRSGRNDESRHARFLFLKRTARAAWRAAYRRHGNVGVSAVAATEPRAYRWLLVHDREWLSSHSFYSPYAPNAQGAFRLPEQQHRVVRSLKGAVAALVEAGRSLPLNCREVLKEAGIPGGAFRAWMCADERFAHAMRPLFHAQGIRATKAIRERLLALDVTHFEPSAQEKRA
ncbi:hypothetical protein [Cupriavidus sp. BIS7]|uniref:hypothetical protein n=1 Tax=Cupriavidus sp. BIS7 TaxID=1217718 RepID=UPI0012F62191|nr:hypothetical protein [Cupriavidus sp. BIS7]